jgi:hypothetical protein
MSAASMQRLRERRRAEGLVKLELWVKAEHVVVVKQFAAWCHYISPGEKYTFEIESRPTS